MRLPPLVLSLAAACLLTLTGLPDASAQPRSAPAPAPAPGGATIRIPAQDPVGIAASGNRMWVTDAGTGEVLELDSSTGGLLRKFKLELAHPRGLAFDGRRLWVADQATRQLVAYNAVDGRKVTAIPLQAPDDKRLATIEGLGGDANGLWAVLVGGASRTFNQVDPGSGRIVRSIAADCDPRGIAFSGPVLFALCVHRDRELAAVDRRQLASPEAEMLKTRRVIRVLAAITATGLAHDGARLWVLDAKRKQAIPVGIDQAQVLQRQQQTPVCQVTAFSDVSWNICLFWAENKGIWIASADIKRTPTPTDPWIRVLSESGPVEILTAYHGIVPAPAHIFDMNQWACVKTVNAQDAAAGTLLTIPTNYPPGPCPASALLQPNVVRELRDRGVAFLCKESTASVQRGRQVVYWSVYDTGNYDYLVEYGFHDDGRITFRVGATGFNNPVRPLEPHVHTVLWRINADIDGAVNNVFLDKHAEPSPPMSLAVPTSQATDTSQPVTYESFFDFDPTAFTTLRVDATTRQTTSGNAIGYVLEPLVQGISRHDNVAPVWPQYGEVFARHDFAVTKSNAGDLAAALGSPSVGTYSAPDEYLLPQLGYPGTTWPTPESLAGVDAVLWHRSSLHHVPSDEDRPNWPNHTSPGYGITLVHWMGFDLVPHNFFDYNPLGGVRFCGAWCGNGVCDVGAGEDCCTCPADCGGGLSCC